MCLLYGHSLQAVVAFVIVCGCGYVGGGRGEQMKSKAYQTINLTCITILPVVNYPGQVCRVRVWVAQYRTKHTVCLFFQPCGFERQRLIEHILPQRFRQSKGEFSSNWSLSTVLSQKSNTREFIKMIITSSPTAWLGSVSKVSWRKLIMKTLFAVDQERELT